MTRRTALPATLVLAVLLAPETASSDISRTEVMDRGKAFAFHPWRCTSANLNNGCPSGYQTLYVPGDYLGVAYKWGGFDSIFGFDKKIDDGYAAGKGPGGDTLSCTTGVDCSGFVSRAWHTTTKYGTSTISSISSPTTVGNMLPGDAFNQSGYHIVLFSHMQANGAPFIYEAAFFNTATNALGGWSYLNDYDSIEYDDITGTTVSNPVGTLANPIVVSTLPTTFADIPRNTANAPSDLLDGCGYAPDKDESGREFIYEVHVPEPGQLTATITEDDSSMDVDVHLLESLNTYDCLDRDDESLTHSVDCGTYYVVVDTFHSGSLGERPGQYNLTISLAPTGGSCGSGPPTFDFEGELGDPCAYESNPNLPYCNTSFDAIACLYTNTLSFCTKACTTEGDCDVMPGGGCCEDIGNGERYCIVESLCGTSPGDPDAGIATTPDASIPGQPDAGPSDGDGGTSDGDGGTGADDEDSGGCQTTRRTSTGTLLLLLGAFALVARRRRRL